jgi:peptide/nickel transport system substrate-binding protein
METAAKDYSKIVNAGAFTAPYEIVAYTPEYFKLKSFDNHWAGTPALAEIESRVVPDEQARIKAVQSGEADLAFYPPFEAAYTLKDRGDAFFRVSAKALLSLLIYLNLQAPPFDDVHVRRAFGLGIDYRQIAEDVSEGIFEQAKGLYPHDLPYAVPNQRCAPVEE